MKKLNWKVRNPELDSVSDYLISVYKQDSKLAQDAYLRGIMAQIEEFSERITVALDADKVRSQVEEADSRRDEVLRLLETVLKGQAALPIADKKAAAEQVLTVFNKYKGIINKVYDEESAHIESLLKDMEKPEMVAVIAQLDGVKQYLSDLRAAQDEFNRVQQEALARRANKEESASSLRKPLLSAINDDLVTHLSAMVKIDEALYGDFVAKVEAKFGEVNTRIDKR